MKTKAVAHVNKKDGVSLTTYNFKRKTFKYGNEKKAVKSEVGRNMSVIFREKSEDKRYACLLQRKLLLIYHVR